MLHEPKGTKIWGRFDQEQADTHWVVLRSLVFDGWAIGERLNVTVVSIH